MTDRYFTDADKETLWQAQQVLERGRGLAQALDNFDAISERGNEYGARINRTAEALVAALYPHDERRANAIDPERALGSPLPEAVAKLAQQRDEARRQHERVAMLVQLAVGEEPGEQLLAYVGELHAAIERALDALIGYDEGCHVQDAIAELKRARALVRP